jgi:hypothetical protein
MSQRLVFVYNANSGFLNAITDLVHKSIKPSTYTCDLCKIAFDGVTMNKAWKKYINNLPFPSEFLHKNEFENKYPKVSSNYPVVLLFDDANHSTLISHEDFSQLKDVAELMGLLSSRLMKYM